MNPNGPPPQVIVVAERKSVGISLLLTILFGPLGMLYSIVVGGIVMFVLSAIVGFMTFGFGLIVTWPICVLWGALAAHNHNQRLMRIS